MKRRNAIGLLMVAFLFAACSPYPRESERMAEAMAQAEAVYGDGSLLIETDTALFIPALAEASQYYAGKRQYGKAALAALYNGYTERDFDKEAAMVSFKEAERYGELAHDSLTMARAEYQIGKMLFDDYSENEALSLLKKADSLFGNHLIERAFVLNAEAVTLIVLKQFDEAEVCLKNSLDYSENAVGQTVRLKALNNYAVLYRLQGRYDDALCYLRQIAKGSDLSDKEKALFYLNIGKTFAAYEKTDSCAFYYQCLDELLSSSCLSNEIKVSAFDALMKYSESQGNDVACLMYLKQHERALYEMMQRRLEHSVLRIQKKYDYEALQNTMNRRIILRHRVIFVFSLLLAISAVIILILQFRHKQMLKAENELRQQLSILKENLQQTNSSAWDGFVMSQLKTIIIANHIIKRTKNSQHEWQPLIKAVLLGKDDLFEAAKAAIGSAFPRLYSYILEKYPNLTETEAKVCLLSCFDLSNSDIAELLGLSKNTINQNRSSLRKKLDLSSEKMQEQLRDIFEI